MGTRCWSGGGLVFHIVKVGELKAVGMRCRENEVAICFPAVFPAVCQGEAPQREYCRPELVFRAAVLYTETRIPETEKRGAGCF